MSATFTISLDFELMWGVRDHRSVENYGDAVIGAREAIPPLLKLFKEAEIRATWATVGLLFARTRDEMLDFAPRLRPAYENTLLSPYAAIEALEIGRNEREDPLHYGRDLIERIADTPGQEIATHTYSHFYCLEEGATIDAFSADLEAAIAIAAEAGHPTRSIVFPRNQMADLHLQACRQAGLHCYRGNPQSYAYRAASATNTSLGMRAVRLLDGVLPVYGYNLGQIVTKEGLVNSPASMFLRPPSNRLPFYNGLHLAQIKRGMTKAAISGASYHLWFHPHNIGRKTNLCLKNIKSILDHFQSLRERHGIQNMSMGDLIL